MMIMFKDYTCTKTTIYILGSVINSEIKNTYRVVKVCIQPKNTFMILKNMIFMNVVTKMYFKRI